MDAVTAVPPQCRIAATAAHTSIHCTSMPPKSTPAAPFVCVGITIWVISTRVDGVKAFMDGV